MMSSNNSITSKVMIKEDSESDLEMMDAEEALEVKCDRERESQVDIVEERIIPTFKMSLNGSVFSISWDGVTPDGCSTRGTGNTWDETTLGSESSDEGGTGLIRKISDTRTVDGESDWRLKEEVLQVCKDEDDPLTIKKRRRHFILNPDDSENEYEFQDDGDSVAQTLFGEDKQASELKWHPMDNFSGRAEEFLEKNPGPTKKVSSPYEAFRIFWDDKILEHIARETNRYATELKSSSEQFEIDWYDTNKHEIMILFAFWTTLGIVRMPSVKSCFSNNVLLNTNIYKTLLTKARYYSLNRALHFADRAARNKNSSKLFRLVPIIEHLNVKFQEAYVMDQVLTIDESLTLWKGNLACNQNTSVAPFGIKTYHLCESATGYLWSFVIYTGKDCNSADQQLLKSTKIVVRLMKPLLNKGHTLYMDSLFNSPVLARFLKRNKTDCVGTLRASRPHVPGEIQLATPESGTCIALHSEDVVVMAYQDTKTIHAITTCEGTEPEPLSSNPSKPPLYRPTAIANFYAAMRGVRKKNQLLETYLIERKRKQTWYKKIFKRLLNISVFNSSIIVEKSSAKLNQQVFRLELVDAIIEHHLKHVPTQEWPQRSKSDIMPFARRLDGNQHFIVRNAVDGPRTSFNSRTSAGRMSCMWCSTREGRRSKTVYKCDRCDVPLCLVGCFKKFHTLP